jgi:hypothetical protein
MKQLLLLSILCINSMHVIAASMDSSGAPKKPLPWHFNATLGYVNNSDMVDANVAIQRIAGARDVFDYHHAILGIELGVQTGLSSRLWASQAALDIIGIAASEMVINPFVDVLGAVSVPVVDNLGVFAKAGMAYRQMHFDSNIIHRKVQISPEVQIGVSHALSPQATIGLAYQGIYARQAGLTINNTNPAAVTGAVRSIPSQNGALLIFAWNAA